MKTESGQLWFPTLKGLVVVDPRVHLSKLPAPAVLLEEISVDGTPKPVFSGAILPLSAQNKNSDSADTELEF